MTLYRFTHFVFNKLKYINIAIKKAQLSNKILSSNVKMITK
jgi:hypothetical protein